MRSLPLYADECWPWLGSKFSEYGRFERDSADYWAWALTRGYVPPRKGRACRDQEPVRQPTLLSTESADEPYFVNRMLRKYRPTQFELHKTNYIPKSNLSILILEPTSSR